MYFYIRLKSWQGLWDFCCMVAGRDGFEDGMDIFQVAFEEILAGKFAILRCNGVCSSNQANGGYETCRWIIKQLPSFRETKIFR
ncbi:hypothetical protein [Eikenella sp. Marseille-P7795]|uniref:hypothetical protein n=1 Tax=Eikenella sp. Marseille-P7795 TaxID=2866577 RepID=UPI001CE46278|nr:hypothetical protein [Eikenella sp. Marseille-P7795]